ncbi:juvenile hormone esterase-like isoform X3 [Neodiprion fabricii]|uniref:juvenile hormone esterase-like isoform X3 n=1 Tax=Neodiprion fabricii TaxID=2872261 RepID=UPI001ED93706|nr:juvenile hormone esterase-like isoform X3 [Neodiprion fabricii]
MFDDWHVKLVRDRQTVRCRKKIPPTRFARVEFVLIGQHRVTTMASYSGAECLFLPILLSIFFSSSFGYLDGTTEPEVTFSQGNLRGKIMTTTHGRKVSAFLGIPYAQPPVGNKRFANPVPAGGWKGIRNATADGNMCPQLSNIDYVSFVGDEDCLNLNVYTPQISNRKNSSLLPVMAYVFGGRFLTGSTKSSVYSPAYLLNQDVVLVTFNYRLGVLGFLSTGDEVASGNWGLKDQVLALEWVQRNIRHFHGDPDRVTLFGHSSGSACVHLLTLSKLTIVFYEKEEWFDDLLKNFDHLLPILLYWSYQPDSGAAWVKAAKSYYFNNIETMNRSELLTNLTLLIGDATFTYPMYSALLYQHAVAVNPQYFYAFRYRGTWSNTYLYSNPLTDYGVAHADDLGYIFPHVDYNIILALNKTPNERDLQMREIMVQLWTSFANHRKPSTLFFRGNTTWEPYSKKDNYLQIGYRSEITLEVKHPFSTERMQFWANLERSTAEAETIGFIH